MDWDMLDKNRPLYEYTKDLIAFRMAHPVLRANNFFCDKNGTGYPEVSFHGLRPWELDRDSENLTFATLFVEDHVKFGTKSDSYIYIMVNAHWEEHDFGLPVIPEGFRWRLAFDSSGESHPVGDERKLDTYDSMHLGPRSTMVLIAGK